MELLNSLQDKDKLFLIFYIGIDGLNESSIDEYIKEIQNKLKDLDNSVRQIFIPQRGSNNIKVECINPVLLDEVQYKRVQDIIDEVNNNLKNL